MGSRGGKEVGFSGKKGAGWLEWGQEVRKIGRCKIILCFVDEENDFKLNTVLHREPVNLMEDGADVLPGPGAGENSFS